MGLNTEELFKDRAGSKRDRDVLARELLAAVGQGSEAVKKLLFGGAKPELYSDHGSYRQGMHDHCDGLKNSRVTEKRICKCLYYRNGKYYDPDACRRCGYAHEGRFQIVGRYQITDYEVPAYYYGTGIGEIDLVVSDGETKYAVEVKPPEGNPETLLRMIAEIMTYTIGYPEGQYHKAIAFFEGTAQAQEFAGDAEKAGGVIKEILEKADIAVFCFKKAGGRTYELCKL